MIKKFTFILICFFSINLSSFAEDKNPVSERFGDWFLNCKQSDNNNVCELTQLITLKDSNLKFNLLYSAFKNKENQIKEVFTIITPLGVNLGINPAIRFDNDKQYNFRYLKCESFGCVISITNNTPQTEANELFDEVIKKFINSNELEVAIQGFTGNPIVIKTSLKGFSKGLTQLQKKSKFN